jgi:hypothetical protein
VILAEFVTSSAARKVTNFRFSGGAACRLGGLDGRPAAGF